MKSYTSIDQSKKLAEILPLESADMAWYPSYAKDGYSIRMLNDTYPLDIIGDAHDEIPAWSLAALIETLPLGIDIHNITDGDKMYYYVEIYMKRSGKEMYLSTERRENLVDACVEMIVKLKEKNLI